MKRTYLIDSENINDIWVELLESLQEKDDIMVFYTDKSAHMGYDRIVRLMEQGRGALKWFKCFEGQNALDFQLVTELGYQISQEPKKEYVIVSNDMGYDAVVRYWQQKGCQVRRIKGVECEHPLPAEKEEADAKPEEKSKKALEAEEKPKKEPGQEEKTEKKAEKPKKETESAEKPEKKAQKPKKEAESEEEPEKPRTEPESEEALISGVGERGCDRQPKYEFQECVRKTESSQAAQTSWKEQLLEIFEATGSRSPEEDLGILVDLCKSVPVSEMALIHNVLVYQFGQTTGKGIYRFIKSSPSCRAQLSTGYLNAKKQRERQYLELILRNNELNLQGLDADGILKIINGIPRKNMSAIHTALVKKLGQHDGSACYARIRNHVKIIRSL